MWGVGWEQWHWHVVLHANFVCFQTETESEGNFPLPDGMCEGGSVRKIPTIL